MITDAATALLSRGVSPSVIEDMTLAQLNFWVDAHDTICQAESKAAQA